MNQFDRNKIWTLVEGPLDHLVIGTKWVFRNKMNDKSEIVRNKVREVAKWYIQEEGIGDDETFASMAKLDSIRNVLLMLVSRI